MSEALKNETFFPEEDREEESSAEERFTVDSDQKAEWCLRKIAEKKHELARWEKHYTELLDAVRAQAENDIAFFEGKLQGYFLAQNEAGNTKVTRTQATYPLPSGKLIIKSQQPTYDRKAEDLIPWLEKNHPELVKIKKEEDWAGLKKRLSIVGDRMATEDGELVPGITVTHRPDKFVVEVKEE